MNFEIMASIADATREANTGTEFAKALKNLDDTVIEQGADFINALCKERGIDPTTPGLIEITRLCKEENEKAQRQTSDTKVIEAIKTLDTIIQNALKQFENGVSPTDPKNKEAIAETFKTINRQAVALFTNTSAIKREAVWESIVHAWKEDRDNDFAPELFGKLAFPNGTVSYIGARTGRGKTTAMVNIGIEALFPTDRNTKPRRVLFVSIEESIKQIARRFALCLAYRDANNEQRKQLLDVTNPYTGKNDPKNAYKNLMRGGHNIGGDGAKTFVEFLNKANEKLETLLGESKLAIFDGRGARFTEITARIMQCRCGDVVVFDYIQKIPSDGATHSGNPDLERIREGSQTLINTAVITESVIIAGAQLNRESQGGSGSMKDDTFTDADFRGCGDLEQDAHNAIGIGRTANKEKTYYGVIKTREEETIDKHFVLEFKGGYSYMEYTPEETKPNQQDKSNTNGKQSNGPTSGKKETKKRDPNKPMTAEEWGNSPND
jgi:hypothetical protein